MYAQSFKISVTEKATSLAKPQEWLQVRNTIPWHENVHSRRLLSKTFAGGVVVLAVMLCIINVICWFFVQERLFHELHINLQSITIY